MHHSNGNGHTGPNKWSTGEAPQKCDNCDFMKTPATYNILLHPDVYSVIFYLCDKIKVEWQMLLTGAVLGQAVHVNGYYIPLQQVTGSTVKNLDCIDPAFIEERDVVATIHSHADMGVFYSGVDDEYTNLSLIKHHIVVNNKNEIIAQSRYDLPCSMVKFVASHVSTMIPTAGAVIGEENIKIVPFAGGGWSQGNWNAKKEEGNGVQVITPREENRKKWNKFGYLQNKAGVWVHHTSLTAAELAEMGIGEAMKGADNGGHPYFSDDY